MRTSSLTATALAALLAGAPVAAMAQGYSAGPAGQAGSSGMPPGANGQTGATGRAGTSGMSPAATGQSGAGQQTSQNDVQNAQQELQQQGFYQNGPIDGVMGPQTRHAVRTFQQAKGLRATGRLDQRTMEALNTGGGQPSNMNANPGGQATPNTAPGSHTP